MLCVLSRRRPVTARLPPTSNSSWPSFSTRPATNFGLSAQIVELLTVAPENPQDLAFSIRHRLKDGDMDQARAQIQKLERLEPESVHRGS